jgi:hypothetical protein
MLNLLFLVSGNLMDRGPLATVHEELRFSIDADIGDNGRQKKYITECNTSQVNIGTKIMSPCESTTSWARMGEWRQNFTRISPRQQMAVVSLTLQPLYPRYPLNRRIDEPESVSTLLQRKTGLFLLIQLIASHFTDWALDERHDNSVLLLD